MLTVKGIRVLYARVEFTRCNEGDNVGKKIKCQHHNTESLEEEEMHWRLLGEDDYQYKACVV